MFIILTVSGIIALIIINRLVKGISRQLIIFVFFTVAAGLSYQYTSYMHDNRVSVAWDEIVYYICMMAGIFGKWLYDKRPFNLKGIIPFVIATPAIFILVYIGLKDDPPQFLLACFSLQNGVIWQVFINQMRLRFNSPLQGDSSYTSPT